MEHYKHKFHETKVGLGFTIYVMLRKIVAWVAEKYWCKRILKQKKRRREGKFTYFLRPLDTCPMNLILQKTLRMSIFIQFYWQLISTFY